MITMRLVSLAQLTIFGLSAAKCYEPLLAFPPPEYDVEHPILRTAFDHLRALLTIAVDAPEHDRNSFSVEITSSKRSLWSHHHTARERNASRPDIPTVNGDALYRIASVTKAFTVLGIFQQHVVGNLSLDDPVDKFFEGLRAEQKGNIPWKDITLRSLASQLSGIPREFAISDSFRAPPDSPGGGLSMGLPPLSPEDPDLPDCREYAPHDEADTACTGEDLIKSITTREPLFAPNQQSSYSNLAFELLGLVISNVTNKTYEAYIQDAIFEQLDMSKSTFRTPPDNAGVIPSGQAYWDLDEGVQAPTGGIFTSSSDLSKFMRYVLTHFNAITTSTNWIQPASMSRGMQAYYGMPWEIFYTDRILLNTKRVVRLITKSGDMPGYSSVVITLPEYDLGITILVAGPPGLREKIQELVSTGVVRAAEQLAILQLQERYAGTFISPDPSLNSSVVLTVDHRGLIMKKFISNSTDVPAKVLPGMLGPDRAKTAIYQLVPTLLYQDEKKQEGERWRFVFVEERTDGEHEIFDDMCWEMVDLMLYGGLPFNEVILYRGPNGRVDDLHLTAFRANLTRIIHNVEPGTHADQQDSMEL
jgi:CubicO group peptidase (beta-lactamase class C family)